MMADLLDLLSGAQDAVIKLIRDALPPDQQAMVRHTLDENFQPPFHLVGDITSESSGGKSDQLEQIEVDVHTVYRGDNRSDLLAMMHTVRRAIDGEQIELDGAIFNFTWRGAIASAAAKDGVTYAGLTTIEIFAEPA
jgi:hypothetical protein